MTPVKAARAIGDISLHISNPQRILKQFPKAPSVISELYTVTDIQARFGLTWYMVYKAAEAGELHALRRHKRLFYAQWEVEAFVRRKLRRTLGKPKNGPPPEYPDAAVRQPYRRAA